MKDKPIPIMKHHFVPLEIDAQRCKICRLSKSLKAHNVQPKGIKK